MLLNFSDRTRTGVFNMVWPLTRRGANICPLEELATMTCILHFSSAQHCLQLLHSQSKASIGGFLKSQNLKLILFFASKKYSFDCCQQSLDGLLHPSIHPPIQEHIFLFIEIYVFNASNNYNIFNKFQYYQYF